jgi:NADPH-dependent ferric siderophore reductase
MSMSGMKPSGKHSTARHRQESGQDKCDIRFRIDLMGVRSEIARQVRAGDVLEVVLAVDGGLRAVVCQTPQGDRVGAVSAFPGLARLIECIEQGVRYSALVERSSGQSCSVTVARSAE